MYDFTYYLYTKILVFSPIIIQEACKIVKESCVLRFGEEYLSML